MSLTKQEILNIESQTGARQVELRRDFNQSKSLSGGGKRPLNSYMKLMLAAKKNGDESFEYTDANGKTNTYVRVATENNRMGGCFYMREGKKLEGGGLLEELESYASSDSGSYTSGDSYSSSSSNVTPTAYDNDKLEGGRVMTSDGGWAYALDNSGNKIFNNGKPMKTWNKSECDSKSFADCKAPCRKFAADGVTPLKKCTAPDHGKYAKYGIVGHKKKRIKRGTNGAKKTHTVDVPVRKVSTKKSRQGKLADVKKGYAKRTSPGGTTASKIVRHKGKYITRKKLKSVKKSMKNGWLFAVRRAKKAYKKGDKSPFTFKKKNGEAVEYVIQEKTTSKGVKLLYPTKTGGGISSGQSSGVIDAFDETIYSTDSEGRRRSRRGMETGW